MIKNSGQFIKGQHANSSTEFKKGHIPWFKTHGHLFTGKNGTNWKGGRRLKKNGYIEIRVYDTPNIHKDGYILEHRYIMEKFINRLLTKSDTVHHINKNRSDNRIENLKLFVSKSEHMIFEHKLKK